MQAVRVMTLGVLVALSGAGCKGDSSREANGSGDSGMAADAATPDSGDDAGNDELDAAVPDGGNDELDAALPDAGNDAPDADVDGGTEDADAGSDAGAPCSRCGALASCDETESPALCVCPSGYADPHGNGSECVDIDECTEGSHNCDPVASCSNSAGSFSCACPAGRFDRNGDGTLCEPLALYASSPYNPILYQNETATLSNVGCLAVTMPNFTPTGVNSITRHPVSGVVYAVVKMASGRRLATLDLATGVATDIGALGANFSSIAFTPDGATLYGVTGDGATPPETLFTIDPATATTTLVQALGNGADGELIAFDGAGTLYHWSGNGTLVTETIQIGEGVTNLPFALSGEMFGAVWWGFHTDAEGNPDPVMLLSTINSNFRTFSPTKGYSEAMGSLPNDGRGLVFAQAHDGYSPDACN